MGVLSCSVRDCRNIMCDRYHNKYGYICHRCFDRLVERGVKTSIKEFFNTSAEEEEEVDKAAAYDYFNKIMPMPNREYI